MDGIRPKVRAVGKRAGGRRGPIGRADDPIRGSAAHSVDEVIGLHANEWILMRVTEYDEDKWPAKGIVVAHSPYREALPGALAADDLSDTHYVFKAVPHLRSGPDFDQAVKEFVADFAAAKGTADARRSRWHPPSSTGCSIHEHGRRTSPPPSPRGWLRRPHLGLVDGPGPQDAAVIHHSECDSGTENKGARDGRCGRADLVAGSLDRGSTRSRFGGRSGHGRGSPDDR